MKNWKLYAILDKGLAGERSLGKLAEEFIKGGADVIQLRDKVSNGRIFAEEAAGVRKITKYFGVQFIINDRADIAKAVGADGVHLGHADIDIKSARIVLGESRLVGISCHSLEQAIEAEKNGADYIGLGPIFKTATRPELRPVGPGLINDVKKSLRIPVVCIGGINCGNIRVLLDNGAETVAVASAVIKSNDICVVARRIKNILERKDDTVRVCQE